MCPRNAVIIVMAFPPQALPCLNGTTPPYENPSRISCSRFIITCSTYSLFIERRLRISALTPVSLYRLYPYRRPELPILHNGHHAMLYNPEAA